MAAAQMTLSAGVWHQMTFARRADVVRVYLDNQTWIGPKAIAGTITSGSTGIWIGGCITLGGAPYMQGYADDLRIFDA